MPFNLKLHKSFLFENNSKLGFLVFHIELDLCNSHYSHTNMPKGLSKWYRDKIFFNPNICNEMYNFFLCLNKGTRVLGWGLWWGDSSNWTFNLMSKYTNELKRTISVIGVSFGSWVIHELTYTHKTHHKGGLKGSTTSFPTR
jgi:hypothetical protein